jgi:complex iron-sulfur molybdoenzyme family reductase subunit beta
MDILIAYKHQDMFRLDQDYYQKIAKSKRLSLAPIDNRYMAGKHTANKYAFKVVEYE